MLNIVYKYYISECTVRGTTPDYEYDMNMYAQLIEWGIIKDGTSKDQREYAVRSLIASKKSVYLWSDYLGRLSMLHHIHATRGYAYKFGREVFLALARDLLFECYDDEATESDMNKDLLYTRECDLTSDKMLSIMFEISRYALYRKINSDSFKKCLLKYRDGMTCLSWNGIEYSIPKLDTEGVVYDVYNLEYTSLFLCTRKSHVIMIDFGSQSSIGGKGFE